MQRMDLFFEFVNHSCESQLGFIMKEFHFISSVLVSPNIARRPIRVNGASLFPQGSIGAFVYVSNYGNRPPQSHQKMTSTS